MSTQNKYFVGQIADAKQHLDREELQTLLALLRKIHTGRNTENKPFRRYVVLNAADKFARYAIDRYIEAVEESEEFKSNKELEKVVHLFRDIIQASRLTEDERLPD